MIHQLYILLFVLAFGVHVSAEQVSFTRDFKNLSVQVNIKYPLTETKGTILLLHGYNLPAQQWCQKTTFCEEALKKGYVVIIPDFSKTTYQEKFYPQTDTAFLKYPTRQWIRDSVIGYLQKKYKLLEEGQNNFILGLSTGARGAALLAVDLPKVFKGAGCLSGDFDQTKLPFEKIYIRYYGKYSVYKSIWKNDDNLHTMISQWKTPVYLAHGDQDNICPSAQTTAFYNLLRKTHPQLKVVYRLDKGKKHDYAFWGSHTNGVLSFFESLSVK